MEVFMDNSVLKKRLSSFRSEKGTLKRISDEVLIDILFAWENWSGPAKDFYKDLAISKAQFGGLMGKAKKLRRDGYMAEGEFKEIKINSESGQIIESSPCNGVEIVWNNGKIIRFSQVDLLVDFLKKAA
jgi:hypothetical protein